MKKIKLFSLLCLLISSTLQAQNGCNDGYFASKKGTKLELGSYDAKDKLQTTLKYEVIKNTPVADGMEILLINESYDKKGKLISKNDVNAKCVAGGFAIDMNNPQESGKASDKNMIVTITGDKMIYPHKITQGQTFADATSEIKSTMKDSGITIMTIKMKILNRKVVGFETIETPAGKFECVKITQDSEMKMGIMGTQHFSTIEYLAKGVGIVKSETMNKKGKKISYTLLTKFQK